MEHSFFVFLLEAGGGLPMPSLSSRASVRVFYAAGIPAEV
jgi:hypothetical protein